MKTILLLCLTLNFAFAAETMVTWKTTKRMFLVKNVDAIGVNKSVTVKTNNKTSINLVIPIDQFKSGEEERDQEVLKILKADVQPNLIFQSDNLDANQWNQLITGKLKKLAGNLIIAKRPYKITIDLSLKDDVLEGVFKGSFTQFGIEPPKVAGGVVAKVADELELIGRITLADLYSK